MEYSFQHYLLAKQSVDDRALNRVVYDNLVSNLAGSTPELDRKSDSLRVIEVGAGIGTMLTRLLRWGLLTRTEYILVDEMAENIAYASGWLPIWAGEFGMQVEKLSENRMRLFTTQQDVLISLENLDVFDFIHKNPQPADLLITHAFLDLLPMPGSLPGLFSLVNATGLAWLTINFDGVSAFEPVIDAELDQKIERLYHLSMDNRPNGGDSQTGRHLFGQLTGLGARIIAAGNSDWVVYPRDGKYPADEAYFLKFILHFFEESLSGSPGLDGKALANWLAKRQVQIENGELVYIAHQMDFLVKPPGV